MLAHFRHLAPYATIVAASLTGLAIADVHEFGNAYFGIDLPQIFPTTASVAGFQSTPWVHVLHALFAYGLLVLVLGHVASDVLHRTMQKIDLLPRMLPIGFDRTGGVLKCLTVGIVLIAVLVSLLAVRPIGDAGPAEVPRDYIGITPFSE